MSCISEEHRALVDRYVDDVATPEEVEELNRLLAEEPEVAGYFAGVAKLNALLLEHAGEVAARGTAMEAEPAAAKRKRPTSRRLRTPAYRRPLSERRRAAPRRRRKGSGSRTAASDRKTRRRSAAWLLPVAAAAAAVVALGVFLSKEKTLPPPSSWTARITSLRGRPKIYRGAQPLAASTATRLRPGDRILTDEGSLLVFKFDDGTTVELNRRGRLNLAANPLAKELVLDSGDLYVTASPQPRDYPLAVNKGRYDQVIVAGTEFEVSRFENASLLKVAEGQVSFGSGKPLGVPGRHSSRVNRDGSPSAPLPTGLAAIAPWRKNRPPRIEPAEVKTGPNMPARLLLRAKDPDGDHLTYAVVERPKHGEISGTAPDLIYRPVEDFTGSDELLVKVSDGSAESETARIVIAVAEPAKPPTAAMEAGPQRGKAPLTVNFYAHGSRAADGGAVTCTWDFGDGSRGEGMTTKHVYRKPGKFTAKLTVRDRHGGTAEREFRAEVLDKDAVNAPSLLRWHYHKKTGRSYLSWRDNSDNETGFYVESAVVVKGRKPTFERVATLDVGETLWRIIYRREYSGSWILLRVRAFNAKSERISAPSNTLRLGYGVGKGAGRDVNWPPPGLLQTK